MGKYSYFKADRAAAYVYLYIAEIVIISTFVFHMRDLSAVMEVVFWLLVTIVMYILFIGINHIFVKRVIHHRTLLAFEFAVLAALVSIILSGPAIYRT